MITNNFSKSHFGGDREMRTWLEQGEEIPSKGRNKEITLNTSSEDVNTEDLNKMVARWRCKGICQIQQIKI